MSHLVEEALRLGAIPICPDNHAVDYLVLADIRGVKDPSKFGHKWVERGQPIYCISQVLPPIEAEKEALSA